jgi:hypothetical protein
VEISTTFEATPKAVMRSYRACHRRAYAIRWAVTIALVVVSVVIVHNLGPALVGVAYFVLSELSVRRQLKPYLAGPRTVTITMNDQEYRTDTGDRATARTWTTLTNVSQVGGFWVLRISNAAAMAFPLAALDATQTSAFEDLMRGKGLLATGR